MPTAEQVAAGYRQNLAAFSTPRMIIHRTLRDTPQLRQYWQRQVELMQKLLADPARSAVQRQQAEAILATGREIVSGQGREIHEHLDFWTDRHSWQARIPFRDSRGRGESVHAFPDEPLTPASFASTYRRYRIYTFLAGAKPEARAWYGIPNPGAPPYGRVSDRLLDELPSELELPPLALVAGGDKLELHAVDRAAAADGAKLKVIGWESIGGRRAVKVEHASFAASDAPHETPGKLLVGDVVTAWLDPTQGYLPLVALWRRHWVFNGKLLNAAHRHVHQILRTTRIEQVPGGGYYPLEGVIELRSVDPLAASEPTLDELIAGKPYNPPMFASHELAWRVERVDPRGGSDANVYRTPLPDQTEIFDEASLVSPRAHQPLRIGEPAPSWRVTRWTDGRTRSLADYRGRVVVLFFWIAWQDACMDPLEVLAEIEKKYAPLGVSVVGIHVGNIEPAELEQAVQTAGVSFPNALDMGTDQTPGSTLSSYHVRFYPTTLILDREGRIVYSSDDPAAEPLVGRAAQSLGITLPLPESTASAEAKASMQRIYGALLDNQLRQAVAAPPNKASKL